ncbi:hypothetical protein [Lentilactobacillus sp. Marseille-Q4993]|uniref:hypothetical protein n=1 Tax=Lentilactobacillus sp. Marseille-Q4993 TaxID=3039492 RepID=UPI0024BD3F9F|nr:hypothetical protein [Lentilactobacillus sp. Marseille-Q4993]
MKLRQLRFSTWLCIINVISMIAYLGYFGYLYFSGKPAFKDQALLLIEVASGIILVLLPFLIEKIGNFYFPQIELIFYYIFIFMAIFLGSGLQMYGVPLWDKYEHVLAGLMLAGLGFSIFEGLSVSRDNERTNPGLMSLFSFCFGMTCGVFWEFYEFLADTFAGLNLQRYMQAGHMLVGRAALYDTMGDLCADFIGALLMALIAYLMMRSNPNLSKYLVFKSKRKTYFSGMYF